MDGSLWLPLERILIHRRLLWAPADESLWLPLERILANPSQITLSRWVSLTPLDRASNPSQLGYSEPPADESLWLPLERILIHRRLLWAPADECLWLPWTGPLIHRRLLWAPADESLWLPLDRASNPSQGSPQQRLVFDLCIHFSMKYLQVRFQNQCAPCIS